MKANELEPSTHTYLKGYWEALNDFGIWKDGVQRIGCLENPIKEVMKVKLEKFNVTLEDFLESVQ